MRRVQDKETHWVVAERDEFGVEGGRYDFEAMDMNNIEAQHCHATKVANELGPNVNKRLLTLADSTEADYKSLLERRQIVLNDKQKIKLVCPMADACLHTKVLRNFLAANRSCPICKY
jgi:hypothetical protein